MAVAAKNKFAAAPTALGCLYQCRYALYLLLEKSRTDTDAGLSVEKFDDIAFEKAGTAEELIQTKHHLGKTSDLTDTSADLWTTLRAWAEAISNAVVSPPAVIFTIITTAKAVDGSAAIRDTLPYFLGAVPDASLMLRSRLRDAKQELSRLHRQMAETDRITGEGTVRSKALLSEATEVGLLRPEPDRDARSQLANLIDRGMQAISARQTYDFGEEANRLREQLAQLRRQYQELQDQIEVSDSNNVIFAAVRRDKAREVVIRHRFPGLCLASALTIAHFALGCRSDRQAGQRPASRA
jgi:hypothetical protein